MNRNAIVATRIYILFILLGVAACTTIDVQPSPRLSLNQRWVLLPVINYSETPLAGERAEAMLADILRQKGIENLQIYRIDELADGLPDLDEKKRLEKALDWARRHGFNYGITGVVTEWRYRSGIDGEPVVGATLEIVQIDNGKVLWSGSGSHTGWGRQNLTHSAHALFDKLISILSIG